MADDFAAARAKLNTNIHGVCQRYLPRGVVKGDWWLVSTPWRVDKNPSLGVHLTSGRWKDFARPEDHGDLIDLISKITGEKPINIVKEVLGK